MSRSRSSLRAILIIHSAGRPVLALSFAPLLIALLALLGFSYRACTTNLASTPLPADNVIGRTIVDGEQVEL